MKFSIITVNFNHFKGLKCTFFSIVSQTFKDYEWIVIDGGSTDGSKKFVEEHNASISYWCSEPDHGIYHAMNKGITHSKGEYLIFMNSGDTFYDKEVLYKVSMLNSTSDIISGLVYYQDNGKQMRWYNTNVFVQLYEDTLNHQGSFIKRHLFEKKRYDESLKIVSDWKFFLESIVLGDATFEYTDIPIALQERDGLSLNDKSAEVCAKEREKVFKDNFSPFLLSEFKRLVDFENCGPSRRSLELCKKGGIAKFLTRATIAILWKLLR